jgi:hypothetical protein
MLPMVFALGPVHRRIPGSGPRSAIRVGEGTRNGMHTHLEPLDILTAANAPAVASPTSPTLPAHTPQCRTSFCHLSLLRASAYPTSGLKVTISYKLVHPVTRLVGNGFVRDSAIEADDGRGRTLDKKESRCRRR